MTKLGICTAKSIAKNKNCSSVEKMELGKQFNDDCLWILIVNTGQLSLDQLHYIRANVPDARVLDKVAEMIDKLSLSKKMIHTPIELIYSKKCKYK